MTSAPLLRSASPAYRPKKVDRRAPSSSARIVRHIDRTQGLKAAVRTPSSAMMTLEGIQRRCQSAGGRESQGQRQNCGQINAAIAQQRKTSPCHQRASPELRNLCVAATRFTRHPPMSSSPNHHHSKVSHMPDSDKNKSGGHSHSQKDSQGENQEGDSRKSQSPSSDSLKKADNPKESFGKSGAKDSH